MMHNCWIVTYRDYHGGNSKYVFYKKEDVEKCIEEDFENILHDLKKKGWHNPHTIDGTYWRTIFIPNTDIDYEWNIELSTIR